VTPEEASILIVDDDRAIRTLLAGFLGDQWHCRTASSAREALVLLEQRRSNLVLTDVNMPGQSGLELCRLVRERFSGVDVIVMSARSEIDSAIQALRSGAVDYVTKPFSLDQVRVAVERALARNIAAHEVRREAESLEERICRDTDKLGSTNEQLGSAGERLYAAYRATIQGLARMLEARDLETRGHSDRVVAYSLRIADRMHLTNQGLTALEQGALLHDIGKIGIQDSVLLKQGALTEEEWIVMREHVNMGLKIISNIDFLSPARFVIGQHHEKYDGSGYPNGLEREAIHIAARVFAVADAYDAITSDRPYRARKNYDDGRREIKKYAGSQFDPGVVDAFLSIPAGDWPEIRRGIELGSQLHLEASKSDIQAFIMSLRCPSDLSGKLGLLCA
jgi:response regulator RpfG family c-di-GMP phosphodiesterase